MARKHQQGFEARGLDLLSSWSIGGAPASVAISTPGYGGLGYYLDMVSGGVGDDATAAYAIPTHAQASEAYIRQMLRMDNKNADPQSFVNINADVGGNIVQFIPGTGDVNVNGGLAGNIGVRGTGWERWEFYILLSDTVGVVTIRIDDTQVLTFSGDTKPGAATTVAALSWHLHEQLARTLDVDDIAYNDTVDDGRGNDTWAGPGKIYGFRPTGVGPFAEFGTRFPGLGEANWQNVDDGVPDDDSTYVQSTASGQRDVHITENTPAGSFVVRAGCVQWSVDAKLIGAGPEQLASYIVKDGIALQGNSRTPGAAYGYLYDMLPTRPNGGEWLKTDIDNTQFGFRAT